MSERLTADEPRAGPAELSVPAPAKLNLFLHITGKRGDGYHNLQTLFQLIDFSDQLHFSLRQDGQINRLNGAPGVEAADDLVVKAALLLQQQLAPERRQKAGVDIRVDKRIPMGGGLGGGSSNAASTLLTLNQLWQLNLSNERLQQLGLSLGADVPLFVLGASAWAQGVGEQLEPVVLPESWFVVICPGVHVSTAELFAAPELTRDAQAITIRDYFASSTENTFESVVRARYPAVAQALDWLAEKTSVHGPNRARLTGTGSCLFAPCESREQAQQIATQAADRWQVLVARGLNRSPALMFS